MTQQRKKKGRFITFEGAEGAGKSTQIKLLAQYLEKKRRSFIIVREPGGVLISERIRKILLDVQHQEMSDRCETLLYMAARAQLVDQVIEPALKKGRIVLCDRYLDSTLAYQGYGNGVDITAIRQAGAFATGLRQPDLTFLFDLPVKVGLSRLNGSKDRIEQRTVSYHQRVRKGYLALAEAEPNRIKVIKVTRLKEEIHAEVRKYVDQLLGC